MYIKYNSRIYNTDRYLRIELEDNRVQGVYTGIGEDLGVDYIFKGKHAIRVYDEITNSLTRDRALIDIGQLVEKLTTEGMIW